jgi:hypothetical protein
MVIEQLDGSFDVFLWVLIFYENGRKWEKWVFDLGWILIYEFRSLSHQGCSVFIS